MARNRQKGKISFALYAERLPGENFSRQSNCDGLKERTVRSEVKEVGILYWFLTCSIT